MSAAITAAVIVAGSAIKSGMDAKKAQEKGIKHAKGEAARKEMYEREKIDAVRKSPAAMAAAHLQKVGVEQVYNKAFAHFGIDINADEISKAMGLDRIIENNRLGLPWDTGSEAREAAISTAREQRENTRRYMENKNAFDQGASYGMDEMIANAQITPDEDPGLTYSSGLSGEYARQFIEGGGEDYAEDPGAGRGELRSAQSNTASSMLGGYDVGA